MWLLLIEDEERLVTSLKAGLEEEGYIVRDSSPPCQPYHPWHSWCPQRSWPERARTSGGMTKDACVASGLAGLSTDGRGCT